MQQVLYIITVGMHVSLRQQSGLHNRLALQKVNLDGKGQRL